MRIALNTPNASQLTTAFGSPFRAPGGVHGGELPVEDEAEPAVGAVAEFEGRSVAPDVEAVPAPGETPVLPVVGLVAQDLLRVRALAWTLRILCAKRN